ncbi:hypothetical protein GCM10009125_01560 [Castellaniella daejeonensis]|jgi:type I restriction enzyme S subunit|uniref:Type I restriction modification DNA specificity domain-containing protein n=1 Tax=Castellaniella daejeonensis TaxID=659013 RepID=A0ABN0TA11_9BURK
MTDATRDLLEQHFDTAFAAPDGIKKLRELILTLAMQGKLVEQDPTDQPASELLKDIDAEKQRLVKAGKIKAPKPLPSIKPDEVPYQLPMGWEWVRLGHICSYIQRGKGPKYIDLSTHRVISQKCVRWYGLDLEPARYIDPDSLEKYEPIRFLRVGDLLWNSTGTGTIGRACIVPKELEDAEIVADSHVTVVRPIDVSSAFLWRWIQSPTVQNEIEGSASGTTNQIELNTSTVINHLMPLPPLPEQHRIVARIGQLMARCDALETLRKERKEKRQAVHAAAIQQLLEVKDGAAWGFLEQHFGELYTVKENVAELRKAILQLAVMGRLVPQDPEDLPASELLKEIDAEKQRLVKAGKIKAPKSLPPIKSEEIPYELPEGWAWVRLGDLFRVTSGKNLPKDKMLAGEIPVFGGNGITGYHNAANTDRPVIVIGRVGYYCGSIHLTPAKAWITDNAFFTIYDEDRLDQAWVIWLLKTIDLQADTASTAQPVISGGKIYPIPIPLPPLPEQHRIVARIDQLMALCDTLDQKIGDATDKQTELLRAVMAQV